MGRRPKTTSQQKLPSKRGLEIRLLNFELFIGFQEWVTPILWGVESTFDAAWTDPSQKVEGSTCLVIGT